jgi:hypothetical protein
VQRKRCDGGFCPTETAEGDRKPLTDSGEEGSQRNIHADKENGVENTPAGEERQFTGKAAMHGGLHLGKRQDHG